MFSSSSNQQPVPRRFPCLDIKASWIFFSYGLLQQCAHSSASMNLVACTLPKNHIFHFNNGDARAIYYVLAAAFSLHLLVVEVLTPVTVLVCYFFSYISETISCSCMCVVPEEDSFPLSPCKPRKNMRNENKNQ